MHEATSQEISTLVHTDQLARNGYYVSSVVDMIAFLAVNQLPLRGDHDSFQSMSEPGRGLFLSLFEYTLQKDQQKELAKIMETIPHTAIYTSHDIQNGIIKLMSTLVTEHIVREVGDSFYSIKVDGTRDPTGRENISIVIWFIDANYEIKDRLLTIATADGGDANSHTNSYFRTDQDWTEHKESTQPGV